jgi:hypothetical protein
MSPSNSNKLKLLCLFILALSFGGGLYFITVNHSTATVLIESEESKTKELTSVFNQIKWTTTKTKDIWMMNQSHFGAHPDSTKWERLAIVIDKTKSPKVARFYQLEPGPLVWSEDLPKHRKPFRASCFTCHSNGPRAIRPVPRSSLASLTPQEKIKIFAWNLRIKSYGRIHYDKSHDEEDVKLDPPFHLSVPRENVALKVGTCILCHKEDGLFARGSLVHQQAWLIQRMVDKGHMPPPGFALSEEEKHQLKDFLRGF